MSMTLSDANRIVVLKDVTDQINRYFGMIIFLFGTVGNILNCLVLSQRPLRFNPCASLFLVASVTNLILIICSLPSRMLSSWAADLTNTIGWLCKLRTFVIFVARTVAFWLITLAAVDRWLLSNINVHLRQMSTLKNAQRSILVILSLSILLFAHVFYCYDSNLTIPPQPCYDKTATCRLLLDLTYALLSILLPLMFMLLFGWMAICNLRQVHRHILPVNLLMSSQSTVTNGQRHHQWKKTDRRLFIMLLVQVILLALLLAPLAIERLYSKITVNNSKSTLQIDNENFAYSLLLLFAYVAAGMPFYIYTLAGGSLFRNALLRLMRTMGQKLMCRQW